MAGFGRNGSQSSAQALKCAERHCQWLELRRLGHRESDIASRFGVTQQAVSKALLKYVRSVPASEAQELQRAHLAQLAAMRETALHALEQARSDRTRLAVVGLLSKLEEREAKMLGLDAVASVAKPRL